jgi:large subunit ribosomal protein L25
VSEVRIKAERRTEFGKGAARRTRRSGNVPGVIYGHGTQPNHVALPGHELMLALKTPNVLLQVSVDGEDVLTLPKSVQRDPVRQTLEHIDLVIVRSGEKVTIDVPVAVSGRVIGALVDLVTPAVSVEAEATHIPAEVPLDIEGMAVGQVVRAGDLTMPAGATLAADPEQIVLVLEAPPVEVAEEEAAEAAAEGAPEGEAAPAQEAAPAEA